jgi:hypothetical protein
VADVDRMTAMSSDETRAEPPGSDTVAARVDVGVGVMETT